MAKFIVSVAVAPPNAQATRMDDFLVTAATSGKAINIVLAHLDAVACERRLHIIHCSAPLEGEISDAVKATVMVLPPEDVLPRHVERG